jgi:hypothetical protein
MKQHITVEQYEESKEIRRKLEDLSLFKNDEITIGKMIEILSSKYDAVDYSDDRKFGVGYTVFCITFDSYDWCDDEHREYIANELCDALWEAVKEVLKGE